MISWRQRHFRQTLLRGLLLRCPGCGEAPLFESLFRMHSNCGFCGMVFTREQGYFVGAIYLNVIATESLIFGAYFLALFLSVADNAIYSILFAMALTLPILFNRHARSLWLCLDHLVDPPPDIAASAESINRNRMPGSEL